MLVRQAEAVLADVQTFDNHALKTLQRVQATFTQRSSEYGDTWGNCQFLTMKAVAREFGVEVPPWLYRALATAAFVDMKHQRMEGGYKDDSLIDGIAYSCFLAQEMQELKGKEPPL